LGVSGGTSFVAFLSAVDVGAVSRFDVTGLARVASAGSESLVSAACACAGSRSIDGAGFEPAQPTSKTPQITDNRIAGEVSAAAYIAQSPRAVSLGFLLRHPAGFSEAYGESRHGAPSALTPRASRAAHNEAECQSRRTDINPRLGKTARPPWARLEVHAQARGPHRRHPL